MIAGGGMVATVGPFLAGSVGPMLGAIALCGAMAFGLSRLVGRRQAVHA